MRQLLVMVLLALACRADSLRLRNGSVVTGTFLGGTADDIQFLVGDDLRHFARRDVLEVNFGTENARAAVPEPPPQPIDVGPDYVGAPFLRGANGYIPLELENGQMARTGGMYGGGGTVYRIRGAQSPVRVNQRDRIVFVIRVRPGDQPPRQYQLYRLEPRMGYRQTQPAMGGPPPALPLTMRNVGPSLYEITPARQLYPGEYALSASGSNESYCFGVDY